MKTVRMIRRWKKESRVQGRMENENRKNDTPVEEKVKRAEAYGK